MQYIASCSFGKDSLAAIIECERRGVHIDKALYCRIMFDAETSAELPEHEEFIHNKAIPLLESRYGIETEILQADVSYCDCFYKVRSDRSKKAGTIWGFPMQNGPWCNNCLKTVPINRALKAAGEHMQILGMAADKTKRIGHKTNQGRFLPLVEWGITEAECFNICCKEGLLSPAYNGGRKRLGCWRLRAITSVFQSCAGCGANTRNYGRKCWRWTGLVWLSSGQIRHWPTLTGVLPRRKDR